MKIKLNQDVKIAGLGMVPWSHLGLQAFVSGYKVATLHGWDVENQPDLPRVVALDELVAPLPTVSPWNTQALLGVREFQNLLKEHLDGHDLLVHKAVEVPKQLAGLKFLAADADITEKFENKAAFRRIFDGELTLPAYEVRNKDSLKSAQPDYEQLLNGREAMVIQEDRSSGSKGTFMVRTFQDYVSALEIINSRQKSKQVVISDYIPDALELTIQGCVTRYGIYAGPLQRQIIAHPLLSNPDLPANKFCGLEIAPTDQNTVAHNEMKNICQLVGAKLQAEGYVGVFGVDCLMDKAGNLFALEVNARPTGATPLLTALYKPEKHIPFYLLHALELGSYDYQIDDDTVDYSGTSGSLLVVHSVDTDPAHLEQTPSSGTYEMIGGSLQKVSGSVNMRALYQQQFVIENFLPAGQVVRPGGWLATIKLPGTVLDDKVSEMKAEATQIIQSIRSKIITKPARVV